MKHEELVKLASASFGNVKAGSPKPVGDKPYFCGAELIYRNDEMGPTAYVAVGWEAVPWKSPDAVTFMVMQALIGSYKKGTGLVPGNISGNRTVNAVANKMQVGCADEFEAARRARVWCQATSLATARSTPWLTRCRSVARTSSRPQEGRGSGARQHLWQPHGQRRG